MAIQLDSLALPDDLYWSDEYESQSVSQSVRRTLDGGIVVYHSENSAGRAITLESSDESGWARRSLVKDIAALASVAGGQFVLVIRGEVFNVVFRHNDEPAFNAQAVVAYSDPNDDDFFTISLKLITI
jgi:hypothetical protein